MEAAGSLCYNTYAGTSISSLSSTRKHMAAEQIPFYFDWKFWSVTVATLAVVLSQLPPLHVLFRRAKLVCEVYSQMHITHKVGNPTVQLHLILNNTGGRDLRIRAFELEFKRDRERAAVKKCVNSIRRRFSIPRLSSSRQLHPEIDFHCKPLSVISVH